ncbi:MAG: hypothetical protein WC269_03800 [Candidatus Gracilibacteria bacterium]|jgi:hypothetical protein
MRNLSDKIGDEIPLSAQDRAALKPLLMRQQELAQRMVLTPDEILEAERIRPAILHIIDSAIASAESGTDVGATHVDLTMKDLANMDRDVSVRALVDNLENLFVQEDRFATADLNLFFSWARSLVHGSDSLISITNLVTKILRKGEELSILKEVSWRKPMRTNITAAVYGKDIDFKLLTDLERYCVTGKFLTTEGRVLSFMGTENQNRPIKEERFPKNPFAAAMTEGISYHDDDSEFQLMLRLRSMEDVFARRIESIPGLNVATLVELITILVSCSVQIVPELGEAARRGAAIQMASVNGIPLHQDIKNLCGDIRLGVDMEKAKTGKTGAKIIPFRCAIPNCDIDSGGMVAIRARGR